MELLSIRSEGGRPDVAGERTRPTVAAEGRL